MRCPRKPCGDFGVGFSSRVRYSEPAMKSTLDRKTILEIEVHRVVKILAADEATLGIILFGSLVTGQVTDHSDADILVVKDTAAPFLDRLKNLYHQLRPQVALDFLVYTHAELTDLREHRPFVREEILKRGKILYERKPGTLALLCT